MRVARRRPGTVSGCRQAIESPVRKSKDPVQAVKVHELMGPTPAGNAKCAIDGFELCLSELFQSDESRECLEARMSRLSALYQNDDRSPSCALDLADCASRLGRLDDASMFARESVRLGGKHPRAFCLLAVDALKHGQRAPAQNFLAAATRVARAEPLYRRELRIAQRLLLLLHFGADDSMTSQLGLSKA